jgi:EmrB/QacA subfamily drug resistance transporter
MKRYLIFFLVSFTLLSAAMGGTIVAVAFPEIVSYFNTSLIVGGWVFGISQLACTAAMPLAGKFCDAYGSKKTFIICTILFTLGSLLCAIAPNIELLIAFRFIQGVALGGFLPVGTSIAASQFPKSRQQTIGLLSATFAVGQIIGPNLGGWLTESYGWVSAFWIFVPFGVVVLAASIAFLPAVKGDSTRIDLVGAGFLTIILASVMLSISLMGSGIGELAWLWVGLCLIIAAVLLVFFIKHQKKIPNPIIELEVLQEKRFLAANAYNAILGFALFGITSFIPLYAVKVYGMSTLNSGFVMTPRSVGVMIASVVSSLFLVRWGYRRPMIIGTIISALSLFVMAIVTPDLISGWPIGSFLFLSLILLINGIGQGVANPAANNACIELMPDRIGTITGVRGMFRQIGAAIGISLATLALENTSNMQHGFFQVMGWTGIVLVLSLPIILMIPKSPGIGAIKRKIKAS